MTLYTPSNFFTDVNLYDLSDPVEGGSAGVSNNPIKALANRTQYLYERLGKLQGRLILDANYGIVQSDAANLIVVEGNAHVTLTLADVASAFTDNTLIHIVAATTGNKNVTISGSNQIRVGANLKSSIYLHSGEAIVLMARKAETLPGGASYPDMFEIVSDASFLYEAGDTNSAYSNKPGYLVRNGQTVSRTDYPRLFEYVDNYLTLNEAKVNITTWLSDIIYQGCFGIIDANTMRLPDDRGLFDRHLDLGRALDVDRLHDYAGGLELDQIKAHNHVMPYSDGTNSPQRVDFTPSEYGSKNSTTVTQNTGGNETRPKNTGKIPLIKY